MSTAAPPKLAPLPAAAATPVAVPLMRPRLPVAARLLPYLERIDALARYSNFGPLHDELVARLARWQLARFARPVRAVAAASGTLALELAIAALGLPPGSRIALPALTFIATATAIRRCGHVPVVADVDEASWLLTPQALPSRARTAGLGAVVPVAAFGMPVDAAAWSRWSAHAGVPVIIDAAGAFGAQATAHGVSAVFSLHATKPMSCGEGGLVLTEDPDLAARLRRLSNFGIGQSRAGGATNAKLSEYHAAVGLASLDAWEASAAQRRELHRDCVALLAAQAGDAVAFQAGAGLFAPTVLVARFPRDGLRDRVERACAGRGIETRRWYSPLVQQHASLDLVDAEWPTPRARRLDRTLLGLPFFPELRAEEMERVAAAVASCV